MTRFLILFLVLAFPFTVVRGQQAVTCSGLTECRQMALDAAMQGEYERFHDLAWRAIQSGPRNDPSLMYLLARAQVLSGRPHDALVMLQRLADMGVTTDAATSPDFSRTRDLPGWPAVAEAIARAGTPIPPPAPARGAAAARRNLPSSAAAVAVAPDAIVPLPADGAASDVAGRFSAGQFLAAGLAYDAVSRRFVIGDALERKLMVVGVGSQHADDMVRASSAGFDEVVALEIDEKRGDLWVVSTSDTNGGSSLHRLQLVSGRPRNTYRVDVSAGPARLVGLAVRESGGVIALDAEGSRLLALAPGSASMTVAAALKLSGTTGVAAAGNDAVYVSHEAGIARVDLRSRAVAALSTPKGLDLRGFEAIRLHRNSLIGLQTTAEGRRIVQLNLNPAGRAVRNAVVLDAGVAKTEGRLSLSISGSELYYLAPDSVDPAAPPAAGSSPARQFVVRRLTLR